MHLSGCRSIPPKSEELQGLLSTGRHADLSPEALELYGKNAANLFLNEKVSLNEGVAKLAAQHEDINAEQVKRICEFANTAVYLALHDKNKTASAGSSYPQFPLADPSRVIQDLSDGAKPTVVTPTDLDYGRQPEKRSSAGSELSLEELFGVKTASEPHYTRQSVWTEVNDSKNMLVGLRDSLTGSAQNMDLMFKEAGEAYYEMAKRHILGGGAFADVLNIAMSGGASSQGDYEKVASVLQPFISRLVLENVVSPAELEKGPEEMQKVAHRVVNFDHPMVRAFKAVVDLDMELVKVAVALEDVDGNLTRVKTFMKESFSESASR